MRPNERSVLKHTTTPGIDAPLRCPGRSGWCPSLEARRRRYGCLPPVVDDLGGVAAWVVRCPGPLIGTCPLGGSFVRWLRLGAPRPRLTKRLERPGQLAAPPGPCPVGLARSVRASPLRGRRRSNQRRRRKGDQDHHADRRGDRADLRLMLEEDGGDVQAGAHRGEAAEPEDVAVAPRQIRREADRDLSRSRRRMPRRRPRPVDLLALIPGMVISWHAASPPLNDHVRDDPPDRLVEHRQAIVMMLARDKQLAA